MSRQRKTVIFDNPLEWGPQSAFTNNPKEIEGKWFIERGLYGAARGILISKPAKYPSPELAIRPNLSGWHDVRIRMYHHGAQKGRLGIFAATSKDRALRMLRPQLGTEDFEYLSLGPRDLSGAYLRLDATYFDCYLDSVEFVPCDPPAPLPPAEKELCGIADVPCGAADYKPIEHWAAEQVRVHAEAGFTTIFWRAYGVFCEFRTKIGDIRTSALQPPSQLTGIGDLLQQYDVLQAAADEAKKCNVKLLGWMRINNEFGAKGSPGHEHFGEQTRFHKAHPEWHRCNKKGERTHKLSFAYPGVRDYLCGLAREILERGTDGLMIDTLRMSGMADHDQPLVDAFIQKTGQDPRTMAGDGTEEWLRFRCSAFTDLLRDLRRMMNTSGYKDKVLYVRAVPQPWLLLRDGCDVDTWLKEGLIDTFVAGHYLIGGSGQHPAYFDLSPIKNLINGRCRLIAQVMRASDIHTALALGRQVYEQGADGTAIYESEILVTVPSYRQMFPLLRKANVASHP